MKIFTAKEMHQIDTMATKQFFLPEIVLMENAGQAVLETCEEVLEDLPQKSIVVFCGKGNNAGDGFVCARKLSNQGADVKVVLAAKESELKGSALMSFKAMRACEIEIVTENKLKNEKDFLSLAKSIKKADLYIDALFGIGFKGELKDKYLELSKIMNNSNVPIISIDIPSGVEADTGKAGKNAIKASKTVTMLAPKLGLYLYPGRECAGDILLKDIGAPKALLERVKTNKELLTIEMVSSMLPHRKGNCHKGKNGRIALIGGSKSFTGAIALSATATLRAGGGLVTVLSAETVREVLQKKLTEVMVKGAVATSGGGISQEGFKEILLETQASDVLAIGPGLGQEKETKEGILELIKNTTKPLVLDADALNAISENINVLKKIKQEKILTPHYGEMARLTKLSIEEIENDPILTAGKYAKLWQAIVVLKGAPTIVATPRGEIFINTTGNPGMATGGTGDVLTGIIAALLGQGLKAKEAALCGVFIHGLAGDFQKEKKGMVGVIAGDLVKEIQTTLKFIYEKLFL